MNKNSLKYKYLEYLMIYDNIGGYDKLNCLNIWNGWHNKNDLYNAIIYRFVSLIHIYSLFLLLFVLLVIPFMIIIFGFPTSLMSFGISTLPYILLFVFMLNFIYDVYIFYDIYKFFEKNNFSSTYKEYLNNLLKTKKDSN